MPKSPKAALVLFAHGARDAQWAEPFEKIQRTIASRCPDLSVSLAFLEIMAPSLPEATEQLVNAGHHSITVAPLFMAQGGHLKQDLAQILANIRARYPQVEIRLLPAIGEVDELLASISQWLIDAALDETPTNKI